MNELKKEGKKERKKERKPGGKQLSSLPPEGLVRWVIRGLADSVQWLFVRPFVLHATQGREREREREQLRFIHSFIHSPSSFFNVFILVYIILLLWIYYFFSTTFCSLLYSIHSRQTGHTDRHTDRQTHRQTDRQTDRTDRPHVFLSLRSVRTYIRHTAYPPTGTHNGAARRSVRHHQSLKKYTNNNYE